MTDADRRTRAVKDHYDEMLGSVYSWIVGDFEASYRANTELFATLGVRSNRNQTAFDLGSGPGCQSIPLAEAGFRVTAIDFCEELLVELRQRAGELTINTVNDDILNFDDHIVEPPELIVCMGDTLVHLPSADEVDSLLGKVSNSLSAGGRFVASLRDYSATPPEGPARFVPVRSSDNRIFTCFLEFRGDTISVHDILHTKENGHWQLRVSCYQKLRLDYRRVIAALHDHGMEVDTLPGENGMVIVSARKAS